ncbi:MAG: deoxyribose-phosphate aldolase [Chlorobiales bacterium]|nr:deoxyribose-phosphate aldolase [Chlorobiales bacterium]
MSTQNDNEVYKQPRKESGHDLKTAASEVRSYVENGAERVGLTNSVCIPDFEFSKYIDHTLLKPEASREEIIRLCNEAKAHRFASVCINPHFVPLCYSLLRATEVKVCTVIGFPLGMTTTKAKAYETHIVCNDGAAEIDMVINIGELKSKNYDIVERDIESVVEAALFKKATVKVIIETALLTDEEKVIASVLAKNAGADFVKTSTGFSKGGATVEDVALMRRAVGQEMGIKAAGGIRDYATAMKLIQHGATRIGASASVKIFKESICQES